MSKFLYETVFLTRPELSQAQTESLATQFSGVIKQNGGDVITTEYCGLKTLAYRIKKNRRAHYVLMNIAASPAAMKETERQMGLDENILRFLSVRVEKHQKGPSALASKPREHRRDQDFDNAEGF
jgi:small subunit ribosomal protein S6